MKHINLFDEKTTEKTTSKKEKILYGAITLLTLALIITIGITLFSFFNKDDSEDASKTSRIGFENIGELDTQVAYTTEVDEINDPRTLFDLEIPFTKSKIIYSYDVIIKAGLNFDEITWKTSGNKIKVNMPKIYVTDSYIDVDSGKVYHEEESIFSSITLTEEMEKFSQLKDKAVKNAINEGLYDKAKENAEKLMTSLFTQHEEYKDFEVEFKWQNK